MFGRGGSKQGPGQLLDGELVGAGRLDQLAKLALLAALQLPSLLLECLEFGVVVAWFAHLSGSL
jgi:hypothetical protein